MSSKRKDSEMADLTKRQKALKREYAGKTIILDGKPYTGQRLVEMCGEIIDAEEGVEAANSAWREAVARRRALEALHEGAFQALHRYVQATHGKSSQAVADFGFKRSGKAVKSAESKAEAVAKLRATRQARHTMGKRQKESVVGTAVLGNGVSKSNGAITNGAAN